MTGFKTTHLKQDEVLCTRGQPATEMYLVLSGEIQLVHSGGFNILSTGAVVGALEFLQKSSHGSTATCVSDVTLLVLDENSIQELFTRQPQVGYSLLQALAAVVPADHKFDVALKIDGQPELGIGSKSEAPSKAEPAAEGGIRQVSPNEADPLLGNLSELLPPDHPTFTAEATSAHDHYLFNKDVVCPICETKFVGTRIRDSRLITKEVRQDTRIIYKDFEPLWYYIWVCPKCLFAYPHRQFTQLTPGTRRKLKKAKEAEERKASFEFSRFRTLNEVLLSYYLAVHAYIQLAAPAGQQGNIWLRLHWLYEDAGSDILAEQAGVKAVEFFEDAAISSRLSPVGYQELYIVLAELLVKQGQDEKALRYLHEAVNLATGNTRFQRLATDRIHSLRRKGG